MPKKSVLPKSLLEHTPWENTETPIWLASVFIIRRNLSRYPFPQKMNGKQSEITLKILKETILQSKMLDNPIFFKADTLNPTEREYLLEYFLLSDEMQSLQEEQGFFLEDSRSLFIQINQKDHLSFYCIDCGSDWKNSWKKLSGMESSLSNHVEFAYNPKFGYLTSNQQTCGTAFQIHTYLHIPSIIHSNALTASLQSIGEQDIEVKGISGNLEEIVGDLILLQNRYTLGVSEETILHQVHTFATKLMQTEKECRKKILEKEPAIIKDKVSRAYGLLNHSYQLEIKETLSALSLLKLGIDLNWIRGITHPQINDLLFKCRRAYLLVAEDNHLTQEEVSHKRSELLHRYLKNVILKI